MPKPAPVTTRRASAAGRRAIARALSLGALALATIAFTTPGTVAAADTWPTKPVRFVVPYPPGGPLDQVARLLAEALREPLGQPMIVENRPGAGGNLGADHVAKSPPDGYAIVMGAVATHAINPYLYASMPYDANRDFTPITRVATVPNVLIMNAETAAELRIGSVADLIRHARANPGRLNYASGGNGSAGHLAGELFKSMAGISMVHIPYKGAAPAQLGLLGGQTDLMFDNLASATPQIRGGKLKAFAVTTTQRSAFFPELPTIAESGLPGFDISTWFGVFGPAGIPPAVVDKLNTAFRTALESRQIRERLAGMGAEPSPMSPQAFGDFVVAEQRKYEQVVKASGARID